MLVGDELGGIERAENTKPNAEHTQDSNGTHHKHARSVSH
jgi:hypothetical protein